MDEKTLTDKLGLSPEQARVLAQMSDMEDMANARFKGAPSKPNIQPGGKKNTTPAAPPADTKIKSAAAISDAGTQERRSPLLIAGGITGGVLFVGLILLFARWTAPTVFAAAASSAAPKLRNPLPPTGKEKPATPRVLPSAPDVNTQPSTVPAVPAKPATSHPVSTPAPKPVRHSPVFRPRPIEPRVEPRVPPRVTPAIVPQPDPEPEHQPQPVPTPRQSPTPEPRREEGLKAVPIEQLGPKPVFAL